MPSASDYLHDRPFAEPRTQLAAARDDAIVADLAHHAVIAVTGDDARTFLHGQLTNDVEALGVDEAQWTGWCSPKGRLVASFLLVRRADRYLLVLPAELAAAIRKRLGMFVLRSKVKLEDASDAFSRIGVAGPKAGSAIESALGSKPDPVRAIESEGVVTIGLDAGRFLVLAPAARAASTWDALARHATPARGDAWEWAAIRAGIPTVLAATQEAFVPQMANFDLIGAVSFRKGCYPGQEIVARTQYRGGLKRRMALVHSTDEPAPAAGDSVYSDAFGEQAAGTIANAAASPDGGYDALVVAQLEALDRGDLHLKSPGGPALSIVSRPAPDRAS